MQISDDVINVISETLKEKYGFATTTELDKAVADVLARAAVRKTNGNTFSLSKMIRGLRAMRGEAINSNSAQSDVEYLKALTTGSTPGSYLVPTIQSAEFVEMLSLGGIARRSGARIWPMSGIQKLTVPAALTSPTWIWRAQNSVQTPTDANLGQVSFDLKERMALSAIPNQLLAVSLPAFDVMLAEILAQSAAEHEDAAIFATSTVSSGPTAIMSASGISTLLVGGSANGGNLAYSDILSVLEKAANVKARGPFAWFASPRTFYRRLYGLIDLQSRPLFIPQAALTSGPPVGIGRVDPVGLLMGYPVFVTPEISETESNGSGTNQSHLIFTNPRYLNLGDGDFEIAYSIERFFDANQTAIRGTHHADFAVAPSQGCVILLGIN